MLGPSTALYRSVPKHCTLSNKAAGAILWDLPKPPQRRQAPLLVGTSFVLVHELASRRAKHSLLCQMALYYTSISFIYCFITLHVGVINLMVPSLWLAVVLGLYKEDYLHFFKCVSFVLHSFCG